ncbi:MAG: O-antigen ligase family protein [Patescibacteria group bacterium]
MLSSKLAKIIKVLIFSLVFTPLVFTPFTVFPFVFGRGLAIQFIIEVTFLLYLLLAYSNKDYRPKKSILNILIILFLAVSFISSLLGAHFFNSFWSTEERFTGFFYLLHVGAFFFMVSSVFKKKEEWEKLFKAAVIAGVLACGIALISFFGFKLFSADLGKRISGTMGNTLFFASYLILDLIISLYLVFLKRGAERIFWLVPSAIFIGCIFLTQSRGAFLGLLGGAILGFAVYGFIGNLKKYRLPALLAITLLFTSYSFLYLYRDNRFVSGNEILSRLTNISLSTGTGETRIMAWKIALKAIQDRPFLGWGVEGYDAAFNKYYEPELLRHSYYETWFDKPHNKILEVGVDSGLLGLGLYLSIFISAVYLIIKKFKDNRVSLAVTSLFIGGLAAYFGQNLFVFDTPVSYLFFMLILGFLAFKEESSAADDKKISHYIFSVVLFLSLLLASFVNGPPFWAGIKFVNLIPSSESEKIDLSVYRSVMKIFNPYEQGSRTDLAKSIVYYLKVGNSPYTDKEVLYGLEELKKNLQECPNSAYYRMLLGMFYSEMAQKDKNYVDLAKKELDAALKLSPRRQHIYFAYGRLYGLLGEINNLKSSFKTAIYLDPSSMLSYWEGARALYLADPEDPLYRTWMIKAVHSGFLPEEQGQFIFIFQETYNYFLEKKEYNVLSVFYERMQLIEPREAKWHAQNAVARYFMGRKQEAINETKRAIEVDEGYRAEGEAFIRAIEEELRSEQK